MSHSKLKKIAESSTPKQNLVKMEDVIPLNSIGTEKKASLWDEHIEKLQEQEFDSIDEAVDALVDLTLDKIGSEINQENVRQFVVDMFQTDPILLEEINNCLKVK